MRTGESEGRPFFSLDRRPRGSPFRAARFLPFRGLPLPFFLPPGHVVAAFYLPMHSADPKTPPKRPKNRSKKLGPQRARPVDWQRARAHRRRGRRGRRRSRGRVPQRDLHGAVAGERRDWRERKERVKRRKKRNLSGDFDRPRPSPLSPPTSAPPLPDSAISLPLTTGRRQRQARLQAPRQRQGLGLLRRQRSRPQPPPRRREGRRRRADLDARLFGLRGQRQTFTGPQKGENARRDVRGASGCRKDHHLL